MLLIFCLASFAYASIQIEDGGSWGETQCQEANKWYLQELGTAEARLLVTTTPEDADSGSYSLINNVIQIKKDSKKREMMGIITCRKDETILASETVNGSPVFKNLPNALTNLDKDETKRIECEVTGYPIPTVSWKFQAIEEEVYAQQCGDICNLCTDDCDAEVRCTDKVDDDNKECVADFFVQNSTELFAILDNNDDMRKNIDIRYSNTTAVASGSGCPMDDTDISNSDNSTDYGQICVVATSSADVEKLQDEFKPKSQLFFKLIEYNQGGKYICVATQTMGDSTNTRTKSFIWRVKDPMAALWPFLALVAEVIVVVCIILYYERASQKSESTETEEGDEFIAAKKEES